MNIGIHASIAGGFVNAPLEAAGLGCSTFQIFSKSPRSWEAVPLAPEAVEIFKKTVISKKMYPVVVHTSYLINLASQNAVLLERSINTFALEIKRAEELGADFITTHVGSCGTCNKKEALAAILAAVKRALRLSGTGKIMILFENSAKRDTPGGVFKDLAFLAKESGKRFGITLDTCHAFAAGYDLRNKKACDDCLLEVEAEAGTGRIKIVHLNDSKGDLLSGLDRHEHLGQGKLGLEGITAIIKHPKLNELAFILETPKEPEGADAGNIAFARAAGKRKVS